MNDDIRDAICLRPFACGLHIIMNPNRLSALTTKGRREQNPAAILCIASIVVLKSAKADRARSADRDTILLYYNIIVTHLHDGSMPQNAAAAGMTMGKI